MIFGKTDSEKRDIYERRMQPGPWFAWYPVKLVDGRYAWLSTIYRQPTQGYYCEGETWWYYATDPNCTQP